MSKYGDSRDIDRRRKHVSQLQDGKEWKKKRKLPKADDKWPTCLIVAPKSVVSNWEREFETVGRIQTFPAYFLV
jgi:DNA excision repair protein ERCC-6-like 2